VDVLKTAAIKKQQYLHKENASTFVVFSFLFLFNSKLIQSTDAKILEANTTSTFHKRTICTYIWVQSNDNGNLNYLWFITEIPKSNKLQSIGHARFSPRLQQFSISSRNTYKKLVISCTSQTTSKAAPGMEEDR
jgi:hypothetical protein